MSRGYSGETTVTFMVNRIKDLTTDRYRVPVEGDDSERIEELELEVKGKAYFAPGRSYGPPEDCYPDESDCEIIEITFNGKPWLDELTKDEKEDVLNQIVENVQDYEECDPDEYEDRDD